jgi:hypothetical protein
MRINPLSPGYRPANIRRGKEHKLGSLTEKSVRDYFGDLGDEFDDIHKGVFFTPHPLVAYAYASDRQRIGYNDMGFDDVEDPPVFVGVKLQQPEYMDTDAMVTAQNILYVAQKQIRRSEDPEDEIDDFELLSDYARQDSYSLDEETGVGSLGGDVGTRPDGGKLLSALHDMVNYLDNNEIPPEVEPVDMSKEVRQYAIDLAKDIIPQSRVLQDVSEAEIMAVLVIKPIVGPDTKDLGPEVRDPTHHFEEWGELNEMTISDFDDWLLHPDQSFVVLQRAPLREIPLWHGTTLSAVREAYPGLIPPDKALEALEEASSYDLEAMRAEFEDEEDD